MSKLQVKLFGDFRVRLDEIAITEFESNRARALLAYIALHADRPHRRDTLATLLWDVDAGDRGLTNLRSTLRRVQNALQPNSHAVPFLQVNRNSVQFEVASLNNRYGAPGQESLETETMEAQIDVLAFEQLWSEIDAHGHQQIGGCAFCIERLRRMAALYDGPLLAYLYVDSIPFETWLHGERERLHRSAMRALHLLADSSLQRREFTAAERYARRQIELEHWNEEAHVQLINILYLSGARSTAVAQYRACCIALSQELDVEPQPETEALFQAVAASTPPEQARHLLSGAAAAALDYETPSHNLPLAEQALIGRARDRDQLLYHLGIPRNRLVTLVGPGGIGKSRLALDVAHELVKFFADGAWLVELGAIETGDTDEETEQAIAALIVETINAPRSEGLPKERLLVHMRNQKVLLVLDNFDRLTAGAGLIQALLQAAPKVSVIVTSRQQLDLRSAHVMALSGLAVPSQVGSEKGAVEDVYAMLRYPAVQLFVASVQREWPSFALNAEDASSVVKICQHLEGLPLGLQLAAGNVVQVGLLNVLQSLQSSQPHVAAPWRDAPSRHQSLQTVFNDSWQLLTAVEQGILARLAVFRAGFQFAAAMAVVGATLNISAQEEIQKVLNTLVKKSLLSMHQSNRYRLHEYAHQFASVKLADVTSTQNDIDEQHAIYYCEWLNAQVPLLRSAKSVVTLSQISTDLANLTAAWRWSTEHVRIELLDLSMEGLLAFYLRRHRYYEGIVLCESTIRYLEASGAPNISVLCAMLWVWQGRFSQIVGELAAADQHNRTAAALVERAPAQSDVWHELAVHSKLHVHAHIIMQRGHLLAGNEPADATNYFKEALHSYQELGDRWNEAHALTALAQQARVAGHWEMSNRLNQEALGINKEMGELSYIAKTHIDMARSALSDGQYTRAEQLLTAAQQFYVEVEDMPGALRSRAYLGIVRAYKSQNKEALTSVLKSTTALGDLHRYQEQAELYAELACTYAHFGDAEQTEMMVQRGLALASRLDYALVKEQCLIALEAAHRRIGTPPIQ